VPIDLEFGTFQKLASLSALRNAFADAELPQQVLHDRGVRAVVGRQQVAIDFAVANGTLVQLAHGWSFQSNEPTITVQQIKAWSWTLRDVRDGDGTVQVRDRGELRSYDVPADLAIDVVYVPPETDEGRRSLDEALEVFDHLNVTAFNVYRVIAAEQPPETEHRPPRRNGRTIPATCTTHRSGVGFCNLRVTKVDGTIVFDPHVTGSCVITLDEDGARILFEALGEWLG
jgi:hypothetical protein